MTKPHRLLAFILLAALGLRLALALQGGQYFWGDEGRHARGLDLYRAVVTVDGAATRAVLAQPEHAAFAWLVGALAPAQQALAAATGHGDWGDEANRYASAPLGAALLSLASVLVIFLVHRRARAHGATDAEALWAAGLAAASNTLLSFSRHLLPYDTALACWLGALVLTSREDRRALFASGLLTGLTYHVYNGYWFLVPAAALWLAHVRRIFSQRPALTAWLAGAAVGLGGPLLVGTLAGGAAYWRTMGAFAGTVTQGAFAEGWSLPWAYLWHSESWLGLAVVALIAFAARREAPSLRVRTALFTALFIYGALVVASVGLGKFVVYGRSVRPLVPLLCLAGGWALAHLLATRPRALHLAAATGLAGCALVMAAPHLTRVFPREVEQDVLVRLGVPKHALSFSGSIYRALALPVTRPELALVDCQSLYPVRGYVGLPEGAVLFALPHPFTYLPFQYEGHGPAERRRLREHEPAIRLVRLAHPDQVPNHPPAAQLFAPTDRPDGRGGL